MCRGSNAGLSVNRTSSVGWAYITTCLLVCILSEGCVDPTASMRTDRLPAAQIGAFYAVGLNASGAQGQYSWQTVSGSLPPGVNLDFKTGAVFGIPTQIGIFRFVVKLIDSSMRAPKISTEAFTLVVDELLQITTTALANAQAGIQYQSRLTAMGGAPPYYWSVVSGSLPFGLSLNTNTGILSGTAMLGGKFDVDFQVRDSSSPAPQTSMNTLTLSVLAFALQITTGGLPNGQTGLPFQTQVTGSGGITPYTWVLAGSLPSGLNLNASSGAITGTPTQAGSSTFTIQLTDAAQQSAYKSLSMTIGTADVQPLVVTTLTVSPPTVGQPYSATLQATGGTPPYTWSVTSGSMPVGLWLSAAGRITGISSSAGTFSFAARVADSASPPATASKSFALSSDPASAPTPLDRYGGDANHPCAGIVKDGNAIPGATGYFYLYKDSNIKHWMFCDPSGNRFWMTSVQVVDFGGGTYQNIIHSKYGAFGSATSWEAIQTKRLQSMGFNTVGEFSRRYMWQPNGNQPNPIPFIYGVSPAQQAPGLKDIYANLPPKWDSFGGYRGYRSPDLYDPQWSAFLTKYAALDCADIAGGCAALDASPWLVSTTMDDVANVGQIYTNQSVYPVAISAPYEQFEYSYGFGHKQVFSDPAMHTKQKWASWLCGTRYANLAALNAAWGSNYSTCDSSASTSGTETIGTGNSSQTSFSLSFAHGPVDPASIGIKVDGVLQGGDTPWFNANVCGGPANAGCVQSSTGDINGGTVSYKNGGATCAGQPAPCITVTFSAAPPSGVAITVTYQYRGWPKSIAGGTGVLDEDGTSTWWPAGDPETNVAFPDPAIGTIPADMDAFLGLNMAQYLQPVSNLILTKMPHHLVGSPDPVSDSGTQIFRASVMNVMKQYVSNLLISTTLNVSQAKTNAINFYNAYGIPAYIGLYMTAQPDSMFSAVACPYARVNCYPTQPAKGNNYYTAAVGTYPITGADGYSFEVGIDYWQYTDNSSERGAYGLISLSDNLYDGVESCGKIITDPWGLTTEPEPTGGCYGDFITSVKAGNHFWLNQQ